MNRFWKANIYEIQTILYWILGELILHFGQWHWVGWISIIYGWTTMFYTIWYVIKYRHDLEGL